MSDKKGLRNFFRSFKGQDPKAEEQDPGSENASQNKEATEALDEEDVSVLLAQVGDLPPLKGALLQIWRHWAHTAVPPILTLAGGLEPDQLVIDRTQLEREILRMSVQLEQDAKRRMRDIEDAVAKEIPDLNAECKLYLSRDKMMAWVFIFPPVGEGEFSADAVTRLLQENGVITGIRTDAMLRVAQEKPYFEIITIAVGTPPVQGTDGSVEELFAQKLDYEVKIDDDGMADYKYSNYVRQVMKDDVICNISLPVPGLSGLRVDGSVVEPKPVKAAKVPKGVNTAITEDGLQLVATMDGHLEYSNQAFQVRPVLIVKGDVDYEVGNINFTGDVHIQGDVRENFSVNATGSVTVDGLVEAASIEAGGDLMITRGVVGDNRAFLKSNGCVRVKYLENCVVYAGKAVYADCIMNSQVFSDSRIEVTTGRGSIIGGAMTAAESIRAKMVGAQSGRRTELTLGVLPFVQNELNSIEEDIAANNQEREELDRQLAYLERSQGLEGSSAKLAKTRMRRSVLEMKEQQLLKRREKLEPMVPNVVKCRLECDVVYPVTILTVLEATWVAKEVRKHCRVVYDQQQGILKETI